MTPHLYKNSLKITVQSPEPRHGWATISAYLATHSNDLLGLSSKEIQNQVTPEINAT